LSHHIDDPNKLVLRIVITVMNQLLKNDGEGKALSDSTLNHLYYMVKNDGINDDFGVGKNGLYAVFSACSELNNQTVKRF